MYPLDVVGGSDLEEGEQKNLGVHGHRILDGNRDRFDIQVDDGPGT